MTKLDRFTEITSIYSSLSRAEKDILTSYINSFQGRSHKDYDETGDFFGLLESNPQISKKEILSELNIDKKPSLFVNGFLLRVREILLESLLLLQNLERPGEYSNRFRNRTSNRKKLIQASILLSRSNREQAEKLLQEVESRAEKYEIPEQVIESKQMLKLAFTRYRSQRVIKRYTSETETWIEKMLGLQEAQNLYSNVLFDFERLPENHKQAEKGIRELEKLEKKHQLDTIKFWRISLQARLKYITGDYKPAIKDYKTLLDLRLYSPPVQSDKGVSDIKMKMGECQSYLLDFKSARTNFMEADSLVKNDSYESYVLRKYLILLDFYETPSDDTAEEIHKRINSTYTSRVPYALANYYLLRSIYLIYDNSPSKAAELIRNEENVIEDAPTEDTFYRNLYLFIAGTDIAVSEGRKANKYCNAALENLKSLNKNDLSSRQKLIIRTLQAIKTAKFDFKAYLKKNEEQVKRLESGEGENRWIPLSNEVMPVHSWIRHKVDKRKKLFKP